MLSNSFMQNQKGPLGHHQTDKEIWGGGTNLSQGQRLGLAKPIMIGETAASNMHNLNEI